MSDSLLYWFYNYTVWQYKCSVLVYWDSLVSQTMEHLREVHHLQ